MYRDLGSQDTNIRTVRYRNREKVVAVTNFMNEGFQAIVILSVLKKHMHCLFFPSKSSVLKPRLEKRGHMKKNL